MKTRVKNLKILIVDDEENIKRILNDFLTECGNECDTASDGIIGFHKVIECHYDFILMDIKMPNMNGIDSIKAIRQVDPNIPILVISGYITPEDRKSCVANGVNGMLDKPFDFHQLLKMMDEILKKYDISK